MSKTKELIEALKSERERLKQSNRSTTDHDDTIEYLETGVLIKTPQELSILEAAVDDFECLYNDYCK